MGTALTVLLWLLAIACLTLLATLVAPLRVELHATAGEMFRYHLTLQPFGRFGPRLPVADSDRPKRRKPKDQKALSSSEIKLSDPRRTMRAGLRLLSDISGKLHIDRVAIEMRFGTGDPAETGELYGALAPFIFGRCHVGRTVLSVEPVFDQPVFRGQLSLDISMTPARLILPLVRFGWAVFGVQR